MTGELKEKIIRAKLTRKESLIAEYILDHLYEVCFMTASDLAKTLNTSNTSINRTAKALGYSVFADLQKELQGHVAAQAGRPDDRLSLPPSRRIVPREEDAEEDLLFQMYSSAVANLLQTTQKNSIDKIDSVVNLLADSRIKYINGYRSTADIANKFGFLLELITNNIVVASGENVSSMARLMDAGPEDCVLVLSFNRYYRTAQDVMESCHQRGAKVVLITDRVTAPIAHLADLILLVEVSGPSFFNSNVAAMFLIETLCGKLARQLGQTANKRLDILEPYIRKDQIG